MNPDTATDGTHGTVPESISVPLGAVTDVAVEHWRLSRAVGKSPPGPIRHALRRMEDFLKLCELEVRTLDGRLFDAGLAVRVVDSSDDSTMPEGQSVIIETLQPMVLWRGTVLRPADVVTRRGTGRPAAESKTVSAKFE